MVTISNWHAILWWFFYGGNMNNKRNNVLMLVEAGIMIALAYILNEYLKIYKMPQGGSVTLGSMLPIIVFSIRWGAKNGIIVGLAFGILDMLTGYMYSVPQVMLDYILAFSLMGLSGLPLGKNKGNILTYIPSIVLAFVLRYFSHVLSGMLFFNVDFAGSAKYNSFLLPDFVICIFMLAILWQSLQKIIRNNK